MSMNYYDTFIEVADDSPATKAETPKPKAGKKTKPILEYEMIAHNPYKYTEEDIAFETYAILHDIPKANWPAERKKFLSRDQACLRVSALAKRYGWGIHNNSEGRVALVAIESRDYKRLADDPKLKHIKAFRSSRV